MHPGERVKILNLVHSNTWSDDNRQLLVYVRPRNIKTKANHLIPVSRLLEATEKDYHRTVLAQIKQLVGRLGLTKEDWLEFIKTRYDADSIIYLTYQQLYEAWVYYRDWCSSTLGYIL